MSTNLPYLPLRFRFFVSTKPLELDTQFNPFANIEEGHGFPEEALGIPEYVLYVDEVERSISKIYTMDEKDPGDRDFQVISKFYRLSWELAFLRLLEPNPHVVKPLSFVLFKEFVSSSSSLSRVTALSLTFTNPCGNLYDYLLYSCNQSPSEFKTRTYYSLVGNAMFQILRGLQHMHSCGLVHHQLNLFNIWVYWKGIQQSEQGHNIEHLSLIQMTDFAKATLREGEAPSFGSDQDIRAVGRLFYFMITGSSLRRNEEPLQVVFQKTTTTAKERVEDSKKKDGWIRNLEAKMMRYLKHKIVFPMSKSLNIFAKEEQPCFAMIC